MTTFGNAIKKRLTIILTAVSFPIRQVRQNLMLEFIVIYWNRADYLPTNVCLLTMVRLTSRVLQHWA